MRRHQGYRGIERRYQSAGSASSGAAATDLNQGLGRQNVEEGLTSQAQGSLDQFEGPNVQATPFYKELQTAGVQGTSNEYDNAIEGSRANASGAGFGYSQPVAEGATDALQTQEAGALAQVPAQATVEATQPELAATSQTAGLTSQYNPSSEFSSMTTGADTTAQLQEQQQQGLGSGLGQLFGELAPEAEDAAGLALF
jgi:hypothetical protein